MSVKIYHNPRCSKSRQTLELLRENGVEPEVIEYLNTPPDIAEIKNIIKALGVSDARDMMRIKEDVYKELALESKNDNELIVAMHAHPILIERPIVMNEKGARIGRPPESVLEIL